MEATVHQREAALEGPTPSEAGRRNAVLVRRPTNGRIRPSDLARDMPVVLMLGARDFKVKFKQSLIGPAWLFVQPLALLGAFAIGFGAVADVETGGVAYPLFALAGLSAWTFFQTAVNMGAQSLIGNYALVTRTACPRAALPLASVVTNLPALAIPGVMALLLSAALGEISWRVALIPVVLMWLLVLTAGLSLLLAGLAGRYHDVPAAMPFLLQLGLFVSPIGYSISAFSDSAQALMGINPLAGLIEVWRWSFVSDTSLASETVFVSLAAGAVAVAVGWLVFRRIEATLADFI